MACRPGLCKTKTVRASARGVSWARLAVTWCHVPLARMADLQGDQFLAVTVGATARWDSRARGVRRGNAHADIFTGVRGADDNCFHANLDVK
jgi:hypothetical protein